MGPGPKPAPSPNTKPGPGTKPSPNPNTKPGPNEPTDPRFVIKTFNDGIKAKTTACTAEDFKPLKTCFTGASTNTAKSTCIKNNKLVCRLNKDQKKFVAIKLDKTTLTNTQTCLKKAGKDQQAKKKCTENFSGVNVEKQMKDEA